MRNATQLAALAAALDASSTWLGLLVHVAGVAKGPLSLQRAINAEAPPRVVEALLPSVLRSSSSGGGGGGGGGGRPSAPGRSHGRSRQVCVLTSDAGTAKSVAAWRRKKSVWAACETHDWCAYALSKKAANDAFRANEPRWRARGATAVAMQPGYVSTSMTSHKGKISAAESARGIRRVLASLPASAAGKFLDWQGRELPW